MQAQDERKRLNNVRLFNPKKEIISPDTPAEVMQLARSQSKLPGPKLMSPAPFFYPMSKDSAAQIGLCPTQGATMISCARDDARRSLSEVVDFRLIASWMDKHRASRQETSRCGGASRCVTNKGHELAQSMRKDKSVDSEDNTIYRKLL